MPRLCYRHNNQISVVIEPGASIILAYELAATNANPLQLLLKLGTTFKNGAIQTGLL